MQAIEDASVCEHLLVRAAIACDSLGSGIEEKKISYSIGKDLVWLSRSDPVASPMRYI
jgi:hypothetical protein